MTPATVYVLIMVTLNQPIATYEFTEAYRCQVARDSIRASPAGPLIYVECFPK